MVEHFDVLIIAGKELITIAFLIIINMHPINM